jgi:exopolysaccharide production protein ExoZ
VLRAIAALMVVILHTHIAFAPEDKARLWWWPGFSDLGGLGVELFFVISGFIIAEVVSRPDHSLAKFAWRRFWRIFPLYWIVMLVGIFFYFALNWFSWAVESLGPWGMVKSFLILPQEPHPFWEPGWSLEHEILFYLIAGLFFPLIGIAGLAVMMLALGIVGMTVSVGWDYHLFSSAQFYFGCGMVAYLLRFRPWTMALPLAVAAFAIAYGGFYGLIPMPDHACGAAFGIGSAALLVAALDWERRGVTFPSILVLIGNASFSLYLWHWLVIPLSARWRGDEATPEIWRWIIVAVSIVVAIASYRLLEQPLAAIGHRKWRRPEPVPAE